MMYFIYIEKDRRTQRLLTKYKGLKKILLLKKFYVLFFLIAI
jgi:hypothetical protein